MSAVLALRVPGLFADELDDDGGHGQRRRAAQHDARGVLTPRVDEARRVE